MTKQGLLFNLPQLQQSTKEQNKALAGKAANPLSPKRTTARAGADPKDAAKGRLASKLSAALAVARQHLKPQPWIECVRDEYIFRQYMSDARKIGRIAIDTETTGLDPIDDKIVGFAAYAPGLNAIYVPMYHTTIDDERLPDQLDIEVVGSELMKLTDEFLEFHNAKFDIRVIGRKFGVWLKPGWCSNLAGNFLNENEPHQLKVLWSKYVAHQKGAAATFSELFDGIPFNYIPIELAALYAAGDPKMTSELTDFQMPYLTPGNELCLKAGLEEAALLLRETEIPLIEVIAEMEDEGVALDLNKANKLSLDYNAQLKEADEAFEKIVQSLDLSKLSDDKRGKLSSPVNPGSPVQVAILLYDVLGADTISGRSTNEETLEALRSNSDKRVKKFIDALLERRGLSKLIGTYIDKMPAIAKNVQKVNRLPTGEECEEMLIGFIHASFNQYGAKTGRFSSSDPNLQNIPAKNKDIRKMFIAKPGHVLIGADYSQQEPRTLAHVSGDENMIQAYKDGKDLYSWIASVVYTVPYDECQEVRSDGSRNPAGKKLRNNMKEIVLGLMYDRQAASIAEKLGISKKEAEELFNLFFDSFPKIKTTIAHWKAHAKRHGFVFTVWGRKRRLPDIQLPEFEFMRMTPELVGKYGGDMVDMDAITFEALSDMYWRKLKAAWGNKAKFALKREANDKGIWIVDNGAKIADAERQCLNSVIQGSSADMTKRAMLALFRNKRLRELGFRILLQVHDELIGQAPDEHALECSEIMCRIMIEVAAERVVVPMKVDAEIVRAWYGEDVAEELRKKYAS